MTKTKLGARIRKYRERMDITQEQLAINTALSVEFISDVEEGLVYPPIGNIIKISRALGQRVGTFMDDQYLPDPIVTRCGSVEEETASHRGAKGFYHYFPLGGGKSDRHMEPMFIRIDAGEDVLLDSHEGEEFIIVVSGKIVLTYGKSKTVLEKGDTVYYNAVVPHHIGVVDGQAEIYAILYVPL